MKTPSLLPAFLIIVLSFSSCGTTEIIPVEKLAVNSWQLDYISGTRIAFDGLYPGNVPEISFNFNNSEISGSTSCNSFSTKFTINGTQIDISEEAVMTMMACPGEGEQRFLDMLEKVDSYKFNEAGKLVFQMDGVDVMRFSKK